MTANKRYLCNAVQFSDQMSCSCGNVWDMNDPYPPECKKEPTMTTDKPEVRTWEEADPELGGDVMVVRLEDYEALKAAYEEELFQVRQDRDTHFGELMRALEQVDAMKAECEKLRAAMIEAKGHISHYVYGGSSYREPAAEAIALIDAAMEGVTNEGS